MKKHTYIVMAPGAGTFDDNGDDCMNLQVLGMYTCETKGQAEMAALMEWGEERFNPETFVIKTLADNE